MKKFVILIPTYNDWKSVNKLLNEIDQQISEWKGEVSVMIVNDASTEEKPKEKINLKNIKTICVMNIKKNQGHARCYATGLKFLFEKKDFDYVILMDGDGEDRPEELDLIFKKSIEKPKTVITADRIKRSEGFLFQLMYLSHKILTYIFTGKLIKFGNYSCLPKEKVAQLIKEASIWSSFSGSVTKIISDRASIPSTRGKRYFGPSKMNFFNLLIHSFSIIAVFKYTVAVRSVLFLIFYLFFVSSNLSIITLFPVLIVMIFLFLVFRVSQRENIEELNRSLHNISSVDDLNSFNDR